MDGGSGSEEAPQLTLIPTITNRRIIHKAHPAQVRLDQRQIFDVTPVVLQKTAVPVELLGEESAAAVEPVDDGVGVLGHRGGVDDEGVPCCHLGMSGILCRGVKVAEMDLRGLYEF